MTSSNDRLNRIETLVESNAWAIAANATVIAEMRQTLAEADNRLRANMEDVTSMIASLAQAQDERGQETDRQLQILIDEGRVNHREYAEFREFMRLTFQEIQQIRQQLAG